MTSPDKPLHVDIPVKLDDVKAVFSVENLSLQGDLPASIIHLQVITSDIANWNATSERALKDALVAWHAGHDYYNFVETPAEAEVALPSGSYERLQRIKASCDPDQMIISAHPVRPIGA
jgi:hypothetical protein